LAFGGNITVVQSATEEYDGSTWTSVNSMNTARSGLGGNGTQSTALAFGGIISGTPLAATEEYITTGTKGIKTITVS
jgi:hypothetical protein